MVSPDEEVVADCLRRSCCRVPRFAGRRRLRLPSTMRGPARPAAPTGGRCPPRRSDRCGARTFGTFMAMIVSAACPPYTWSDAGRDEVALARLAVVRELVADGHRDGIRALRVVDRSVPVSAEGVRVRAAVEDIAREGESAVRACRRRRRRPAGMRGRDPRGEGRRSRSRRPATTSISRSVRSSDAQKASFAVLLRAAAACGDGNCRVDEMHPAVIPDHKDPVRLAGAGLEGHDVVRERDRARLRDAGAAKAQPRSQPPLRDPALAQRSRKRRRPLPPAPPLVLVCYAACSKASSGSAATASSARFLRGTKRAAIAPAPTSTAPTQSAGVSPST